MTGAYLDDNPPARKQFRKGRRSKPTGCVVYDGCQLSEPGAAPTAPAPAQTYPGGPGVADATCSIDGCERTVKARGWCNAHYQRWCKYGDPAEYRKSPTPADERFWGKVDRSGGASACWPWTASVSRFGYGRLQKGGRNESVLLAHRVSWEMATGISPVDLCVLHLCDNPPCVNPDHLVLGTHAANMLDMANKARRKGRR